MLRDTGASQSLLLEGILPLSDQSYTGSDVLIQGVGLGVISVPLHVVNLYTDLVSGPAMVGIRPTLPVQGVSFILGNDLAGERVMAEPCVSNKPQINEASEDNGMPIPDIFPACAVTRMMARRKKELVSQSGCTPQSDDVAADDTHPNLADTFISHDKNVSTEVSEEVPSVVDERVDSVLTRDQLIKDQQVDPELSVIAQHVLSEKEAANHPVCYFLKADVLMRKWRPPDVPATADWKVTYQIVVPQNSRETILKLALSTPMAGHLGVNKTCNRILSHFYWPGVRKDVVKFCKLCHTCQLVGKPNQKIPVAPLKPIPAFSGPFSRVIVDCIGPLPKTKAGHQYLLTIMCTSTQFPEVVPLRNIKAKTIIHALVKFFSFVSLPRYIQSDQGSNFMSGLFQQVMYHLGIEQVKSSAYHPESQGALERFHQTLKNMLRTYCVDTEKEWDEGVHLVLFAAQ